MNEVLDALDALVHSTETLPPREVRKLYGAVEPAVRKRLEQLRLFDRSLWLRKDMQEWVQSHERGTMGVLANCAKEAFFTHATYRERHDEVTWASDAEFAPGASVGVQLYSADEGRLAEYTVYVNDDEVHRCEDNGGFAELESETVAAFAKEWGTTKEIAQSFVQAAAEAIERLSPHD